MLVEVPDTFLQNPKILSLSNLTMLHYFNREVTDAIEVKINQHLLLHIFHGSKIVQEKEEHFRVNAKESIFISKGQYVISEILSLELECFDGLMIFFDDAFLIAFFTKYADIFEEKQSPEHLNELILVEKESSLHDTMLSMNAYIKQENSSEALLRLKFEEILLQALENDKSQKLYGYLSTLYQHGMANFKNMFEKEEFSDVQSMIKKSELSEDKFRKVFFESYEMTPKEWLMQRAFIKAKHLLQEGNYNVTEVSEMCDFHSLSWFIKQFKAKFGLTPKQFQQNSQKSP